MNQMMMILIRGRNIRPPLIAQTLWPVFAQKIKAMLKDIKDGVFGDIQRYVFTIEFSKVWVCLNIHLLIFLRGPYKIP